MLNDMCLPIRQIKIRQPQKTRKFAKFWSLQIYQLYGIPDPPCYKIQDMPMMPN